MIELYYWPTPNGHKITIFLEEAGLPYEIKPVDISAGDQFKPEFLAFSPNNRMPAIIDRKPMDGGEPVAVFESGAILVYLAEKTGRFIGNDLRSRKTALEWVFWQMGGLGPMAGQNHHFVQYAPERIRYAMERYVKETNRLYGVLDRHLAGRDWITGDYSIADMASYPWIVPWKRQQQDLDQFPNLKRWFEAMRARPAVVRAYEKGTPWTSRPAVTEEGKKLLFGQTAAITQPKPDRKGGSAHIRQRPRRNYACQRQRRHIHDQVLFQWLAKPDQDRAGARGDGARLRGHSRRSAAW